LAGDIGVIGVPLFIGKCIEIRRGQDIISYKEAADY
jgi:hypothetical protein